MIKVAIEIVKYNQKLNHVLNNYFCFRQYMGLSVEQGTNFLVEGYYVQSGFLFMYNTSRMIV